jgi:phosphoglycolate phosphatase-like HAD superfamily hydrolase
MQYGGCVVFDLDSTLLDTFAVWSATRNWILEQISSGLGMDLSSVADAAAPVFRDDFHNPLVTERIVQAVTTSQGRQLSQLIGRVEGELLGILQGAVEPLPGVIAAIEACKQRGWRVVVFTNNRSPYVELYLSLLGLSQLIDSVLCQCKGNVVPVTWRDAITPPAEVVHLKRESRKPNPMALRELLRKWDIGEVNTLVVGNNIRNDGGLTVDSEMRFVWSEWGIPAWQSREEVFRLTKSTVLAFGVGGISKEDYTMYLRKVQPVYRVRETMTEILDFLT